MSLCRLPPLRSVTKGRGNNALAAASPARAPRVTWGRYSCVVGGGPFKSCVTAALVKTKLPPSAAILIHIFLHVFLKGYIDTWVLRAVRSWTNTQTLLKMHKSSFDMIVFICIHIFLWIYISILFRFLLMLSPLEWRVACGAQCLKGLPVHLRSNLTLPLGLG